MAHFSCSLECRCHGRSSISHFGPWGYPENGSYALWIWKQKGRRGLSPWFHCEVAISAPKCLYFDLLYKVNTYMFKLLLFEVFFYKQWSQILTKVKKESNYLRVYWYFWCRSLLANFPINFHLPSCCSKQNMIYYLITNSKIPLPSRDSSSPQNLSLWPFVLSAK